MSQPTPCGRSWVPIVTGLVFLGCGGDEPLRVGDGPPASLVPATAAPSRGFVGNVLAPPSFRVRDASGGVLPGIAVTFRVDGGGTLATQEATTDGQGLASPGGWRLGEAPGTQRLTAEAAGQAGTYVVQAVAPPASGFSISVIFDGAAPSPDQRDTVMAAVHHWEELVIGDLPDMRLPEEVPSQCPLLLLYPRLNVDDLLIIVALRTLPIGTIGATVLCHRRADGGLPSVAFITVNPFAVGATAGLLRTLKHEIAHALGFGTIWSESLLRERGGDLRFFGRSAEAAFLLATGTGGSGVGVPVEMTGGTTLARSHWRESVLDRELLTPLAQAGDQPLSAITVASLRDLGYVVNDARADPFVAPGRAATSYPAREQTRGAVPVTGPRSLSRWVR